MPSGSERMFLIGHCHGGPPAIVYAASHPERVAGLILMSTFANGKADVNHPGALSEEDFASWMEAVDHWGEGRSMSYFNPSRDEGRLYRHLYASFERAALSRGMARAAVASTRDIDVTTALGSIRVPTMVMHCTDDFLPVESGKFLATSIPGARFVELDGADHAPFVGTGSSRSRLRCWSSSGRTTRWARLRASASAPSCSPTSSTPPERRPGTATSAGRNCSCATTLAVREEIDRRRGECLKFTGDGYLATFTSVRRRPAMRCRAADESRRVRVRDPLRRTRRRLHGGR